MEESKVTLLAREPGNQIDNNYEITYADIDGYILEYDCKRRAALKDLNWFKENTKSETFSSRCPSWEDQNDVWEKFKPLVHNTKQILRNQREYNRCKNLRKNLPVVIVIEELMKRKPSSTLLSEIQEKVKTAETLFKERPLTGKTLEDCNETYNSAAKVYPNVEKLAGGLQPRETADETAERINEKLIKVRQMRDLFLSAQSDLNKIDQLKKEGFQKWSDKCLTDANNYYNSFKLEDANDRFSLLSQICGTVSDVKNYIFKNPDAAPTVSRLMELCSKEFETFEKYPNLLKRLDQVHEKKDVLAKYKSLRQIIPTGPKGVPLTVYELLADAKKLYDQDNVKTAKEKLEAANKEYKKFLIDKISNLERDCSSLLNSSFVDFVDQKGIRTHHKNELIVLRLETIPKQEWVRTEDVDEYNEHLAAITKEKDVVKRHFAGEATALIKNISKNAEDANAAEKAERFWESETITGYVKKAKKYDSNDVNWSISNWKNIDDITRLLAIVDQMEDLNARLENKLTRKNQLDRLGSNINKVNNECNDLPPETEGLQDWLSQLKKCRKKLITRHDDDGRCLIDHSNERFNFEYGKIWDDVNRIDANLPRYSAYVKQLIEKEESLKERGRYVRDVVGVKEPFDSNCVRNRLDIIKTIVNNNWPKERFNREICSENEKCKPLADMAKELERQCQATGVILKAIKELDGRINNILSDEDIRELINDIAATTGKPSVLEQLQSSFNQCREVLRKIEPQDCTAMAGIFPTDKQTDFNIKEWFPKFSKADGDVNTQVACLQQIDLKGIAEYLMEESPIEVFYYNGYLKKAAITAVDKRREGSAKELKVVLNAVKSNSSLKDMNDFLVKMGNPILADPIKSLTDIDSGIEEVNKFEIKDLPGAEKFNRQRKELLGLIEALGKDLTKFNELSLESACERTISDVSSDVNNLMKEPNQIKLLWEFYPRHKSWSEWSKFLDVFHITFASDGQAQFASLALAHLQPLDKNGKETSNIENPNDFFWINEVQKEKDKYKIINFGWPKYAAAKGDSTIKFVFVPAGDANPQPFYMAAREITNAQYRLFLEKSSARNSAKPQEKFPGWSLFVNQKNNKLISCASFDYPPCGIKWDESRSTFTVIKTVVDTPVTWVTFYGAQSYARWIGGQLPTASQHEYACRGGTNSKYPWGNDVSQVPRYAHVRAAAWQYAASEYNSKINNPLEMAHQPIGAVKDFQEDKTLDLNKVVYIKTTYNSAWPVTTTTTPNAWGLYDMIGNVWEWCDEGGGRSVICGGSCLAPPEYICPDSKYKFDEKACDVGFRVIIPAR